MPLIGRGTWTGGYVYLKNTLKLIRSRLEGEIEASVFLSPAELAKYGTELAPLVEGRLIVDEAADRAGRGGSLVRAVMAGRDVSLERALQAAGIDVTFEIASFYGARFRIPVIAWMPDFQHRHMPEMFSRANWWRRDIGFRAQIRAGRTVMVSSETARDDLSVFYGLPKERAHVVRFAIDLDIAAYLGRGQEMRALYSLPERFFFLPNQFWQHKNHTVVVEALARLKGEGRLDEVPPVVLSGLAKDLRNPLHFDRLMAKAHATGVESHFRYLGLIPYDHVLSLNAACERMINPSLFEGWSTPIEEAKALGTPLLLSDLPIHREQAPDAHHFDATSVEATARSLALVAKLQATRRPLAVLTTTQSKRLASHADTLLDAVRSAYRGT